MTSKVLIRGGCVLTLGAKTPNFPQADVLIEDGRVAEVGPGLRARDAEQVDAADTIVMPGFVDTHRHAWRSLFRNLGDPPSNDGDAGPGNLGAHFRPDDVYAATLAALLGAVEAGITTVVDWADIPFDDAAADAALQAHADAGLRTVFVDAGSDPTDTGDPGATRRRATRLGEAAGPSTTIAFGSPGPADPGGAGAQWAPAREMRLPIHVHVGPGPWGSGAIAEVARQGHLGEDVVLVHCAALTDADLDAIASSRASVSMTPASEMAGGLGSPPIQQLIDRGIRPGLGVDDERVAPGDLFAQMRATISLQHATAFDRKLAGRAGVPKLMSTRDVIRHATVDGARVAGLRGVAGSLEAGMQADVVVLRTDRPNVFPLNDPIGAVVWGMDTSNVDWVFAAGQVLMRGGVLEADVARARTLVSAAQQRLAAASDLAIGVVPGAGR